jgi:hypothetical protein
MLKPTMDSPLIPQVNTFLALDSARASSGNLYHVDLFPTPNTSLRARTTQMMDFEDALAFTSDETLGMFIYAQLLPAAVSANS